MSENSGQQRQIADDDGLSVRKSLFVLVIVVGCFAVLWPNILYPMLMGRNDRRTDSVSGGCCEVFTDSDMETIKFLSELCDSWKWTKDNCRNRILGTCGFDIGPVLVKNLVLSETIKQMLDNVRTFNNSFCLKDNFGADFSRLGIPHKVIYDAVDLNTLRQERPIFSRNDMVHPAYRERGRAIPYFEKDNLPVQDRRSESSTRIVDGRPPPIPGLRPPLGAGAHTPSQKQTSSNMNILMPIYTIAIVIFFTYTILKIAFKKNTSNVYPDVHPDPIFRKEVFDAAHYNFCRKNDNDNKHKFGKKERDTIVNAMSALLDEVDQELEARKQHKLDSAVETPTEMCRSKKEYGTIPKVTVLGMETRASCEGGQKWNRSESPIPLPVIHLPEKEPDPQRIYLDAVLPPESRLIVSDTAVESQCDNSTVVLAGKMTLSVVGPESFGECGTDVSKDSSKTKESTLEDFKTSSATKEIEKNDGESSHKSLSEDQTEIKAEEPVEDIGS